MGLVTCHRRGLLMLAVLALLWAALAPLLAHVVGPKAERGGERVQICTSTGMAWVVKESGSQAESDAAGGEQGVPASSCDGCLLHGGSLLTGTTPLWSALLRPDASWGRGPMLSATHPLSAWWRPQPHAPPMIPV